MNQELKPINVSLTHKARKGIRFYAFLLFCLIIIKALFFWKGAILPDEAYYWLWSKNIDLSYYDHPPLSSWFQGLLSFTIPNKYIEVRIIPTLCFAIIYSQMGAHQIKLERVARDLGATEWQVILIITVPLMWPAIFAAFFLSLTFSWDEFIIAFMVSRFDVTLPVEIWSMLRTGLDPKTNAVGSFVFLVSVAVVFLLDLVLFRRKNL